MDSDTSVVRSSSGRVCCETTAFPQKSNESQEDDHEQDRCFPRTRGRLLHILSKLVLNRESCFRAPAKKKKPGSRLIGFQTVPVEDVNRDVEPGSPVVTCIGQVRARKQINKDEFDAALKKQSSSSSSKRRGFCLRCQLPKEKQGMQHQEQHETVQPPSCNGSVLAKSLVLLQQQMELAGNGIGSRDRSTGAENYSSIDMVHGSDVRSSEPVATQVAGDESCLWRRRCIPQPKLLELNKSMPVVV